MKELENLLVKGKSNNVVHSTLTWFLAAQRRGTHSTKTRGEVSGGGKKPWKQKGTGRARAGSTRSPLWRKGGVTFGPKPRDYNFSLPKKMRKLALRIVLSDRAAENKVKVVPELKVEQPKSSLAAALLKEMKIEGKVIFILGQENEIFIKASRNLKGVKTVNAKELNIFDLLNADWIVLEKNAVSILEEVLK